MTETVLVTGGAGYIGSHACKALAEKGYRPVAYDNLSTGNRSAVRWGPLEHGDIADRDRLLKVMRAHAPVAVLHFAASAYVGESMTDPEKYYANNIGGTLSLLACMRHRGIDRLVFSSTCATYGIPETLPITESTPQSPINPYGRTKLVVEQILADYAQAYGLSAVALRYFNAAGADPDNEIGECHDPETHLIPLVLGAALDHEKPVTVMGTDYATPDGTCIRDYIHVSDLADAHVHALRHAKASNGFSAFNLGTGRGHSVHEVVEAAQKHTQRKVAARMGARRAGDPAELVAAAGKAQVALGWTPRHSDIETIVATAWRWMTRK